MGNKVVSKASRIKCNECDHEFDFNIKKATVDIKCPKCKGYDTEII